MKPEKKVVEQLQSIHMGYTQGERVANARGYNQGLDAREKWLKEFLPSEEEIEKICEKVVCKDYRYKKDIAKAISKRLEIK